jgi:hypothetical protein
MASPKMPGSESSNGRSTGPKNTPDTTPSTGARSTPGTGISNTPSSEPSTGSNNGQRFGQSFNHRLTEPPRGQTPAFMLIRDIPYAEKAIGDFHGVPANSYPHRDIPSIIIAHISNPETFDFKTNTLKPEPKWAQILHFFSTDTPIKFQGVSQGIPNLQDLYMFMTRIAIPNAVIQNRLLTLGFYADNQGAPPNIRLRYDAWGGSDYIEPEQEPPLPPNFERVAPRPILTSGTTPNGTNFAQWLRQPLYVQLTTPNPRSYSPPQLQLRRNTQLDLYLEENEAAIRGMHPRALLNRTVKVLRLFWWVCTCNAKLAWYLAADWKGMQGEVC